MLATHKVCPACGHPITDDLHRLLSPREGQLYDVVRAAGTAGVPRQRIEDVFYASRAMAGYAYPSSATKIVHTVINKLNKKLAPLGLRVKGSMGGDRRYRLIRLS